MKTEKLGQEPLFVYVEKDSHTPFGFMDISHSGISQRLYLAGMAMQGILASSNSTVDIEYLCTKAFELADELLKQEAE